MSSTELTRRSDEDDESPALTMADSRSLDLVFALARAHDVLLDYVARTLEERGYRGVTPPVLAFLGQLDCGVNVASEVARRLGQSRQMVAKTVRQLSELGYLEMAPDPERGNQKVITFTASGERLVAEARHILAAMDVQLDASLGETSLAQLVSALNRVQKLASSG
jgi:DNA-binding MarR family transcriptional regulator